MTIHKPFFRIARPFPDGEFINDCESIYFTDPRYSADRVDFIRSYHLLEKDLIRLFEFVEPADANLKCYSHEIYSLLLRACTEFEANARSILVANGYDSSRKNWNIEDYYKLNDAMRLSEYAVSVPIWNGSHKRHLPFEAWSVSHKLPWYSAYNKVKHDRFGQFRQASLENAVNAVGAVFSMLFAQFNIFAFDPYRPVNSHLQDGNTYAHDACMLSIELPTNWPQADRYDFQWKVLENQASPFQKYSF